MITSPVHRKPSIRCRTVVLVLVLQCCCAGAFLPSALADDPGYTLDQIIAAVSAAEEQLPSLSVSYTQDLPSAEESKPGSQRRWRTTERYSHKLPEGWIAYEVKGQFFDPITDSVSLRSNSDFTLTFDGNVTRQLMTRPAPSGRLQASVWSGKHDPFFDAPAQCFHFWLWRPGPAKSYPELFRENECSVSTGGELQGVKTVRVDCRQVKSRVTTQVWFAPQRSWLALKMNYTGELPDNTIRVIGQELSDLVQLENGVWYPRLIRRGMLDDPYRHTTIRVEQVSAAPLPHGYFEQPFPPNTYVIDTINKQTYVTTGPTAGGTPTTQDTAAAEQSLRAYVRGATTQATGSSRP